MKTKLLVAGLCIAALVFTSCNVQKRLYRDGWYVTGNHKINNGGGTTDVKSLTEPDENVISEAEATMTPQQGATINSSEIIAPAEERSVAEPTQVILEDNQNLVQVAAETVKQPTQAETRSMEQKAPQPAAGKSQLVALLLCIFLGVIGAHRFYLGYTGLGVLMIFTLGGLGIWWLIDLIRIITGSLKPKGGDYTETL